MEDAQDRDASWAREGYERVDTLEMAGMLACGERVFLPPVTLGEAPEWLCAADAARADDAGREVVSVEEVGEEEVQCIMVDDPDHLYLTDGLIPTHNTANIIFLKSTDDAMIETLTKMSGTTHQSYVDSKTVTRDVERVAMKNEGKISYQKSTKEQPVISYNDLAFIPPRNAIVFVAGGIGDKTSASVIWDRNETALPMSWRLLWTDPIKKPGTDYTLQTIPTLSSAIDFDVRANQPNFSEMILKRMEQALYVDQARSDYMEAMGYSEDDMTRLDIDVSADAIMDIVRARVEQAHAKGDYLVVDGLTPPEQKKAAAKSGHGAEAVATVEEDAQAKAEQARRKAEYADAKRPRYAGNLVSRFDLVGMGGSATHSIDDDIVRAFTDTRAYFERDRQLFSVRPDGLHLRSTGEPLIVMTSSSDDLEAMQEAADAGNPRVADGVPDDVPTKTWEVTDAMYAFLASLESWSFAGGRFEQAMTRELRQDEERSGT